MNFSNEAEDIRRHMRAVRRDVREDVGSLLRKMHDYSDWRYYWRNHPWICLGTAAALGFLAVPRKKQVIAPDAETLAELAKRSRFVVQEQVSPAKADTLAGLVLGMAGKAILQGTMSYLEKNGPRLLQEFWSKKQQ